MNIPRVHVRRTDKLSKEASYHSIEEYMAQVYNIISCLHSQEYRLTSCIHKHRHISVFIFYFHVFAWEDTFFPMCIPMLCLMPDKL